MKFSPISSMWLLVFTFAMPSAFGVQCAIQKEKMNAIVVECSAVSKKIQLVSKTALCAATQFVNNLKSWGMFFQEGLEAFLTDDTDEELAGIYDPSNNDCFGVSEVRVLQYANHKRASADQLVVIEAEQSSHAKAAVVQEDEKKAVHNDDEGYVIVDGKDQDNQSV